MFRTSIVLTCAALALSISAAVSAPQASAQAQTVTVNVPFNFSANDHKMPAGQYRVSLESPRYLSFLNTATGKEAYLMAMPGSAQNSQDQGRLIFHRYGNSNYLSQVWMPGQGEGREFIRSRGEQETLRGMASTSTALVQIPVRPAQR